MWPVVYALFRPPLAFLFPLFCVLKTIVHVYVATFPRAFLCTRVLVSACNSSTDIHTRIPTTAVHLFITVVIIVTATTTTAVVIVVAVAAIVVAVVVIVVAEVVAGLVPFAAAVVIVAALLIVAILSVIV
jgi:hypothetical protein